MSIHPLITLATDRQVKQAKGFRAAAADLTGQSLEPLYKEEAAGEPKRHDQDKKYLGQKTIRTPSARQNGKDDKHFCLAAGNQARSGSLTAKLPNGTELLIVDGLVPLRTAAPDRAAVFGHLPPCRGIGRGSGRGSRSPSRPRSGSFAPPPARIALSNGGSAHCGRVIKGPLGACGHYRFQFYQPKGPERTPSETSVGGRRVHGWPVVKRASGHEP